MSILDIRLINSQVVDFQMNLPDYAKYICEKLYKDEDETAYILYLMGKKSDISSRILNRFISQTEVSFITERDSVKIDKDELINSTLYYSGFSDIMKSIIFGYIDYSEMVAASDLVKLENSLEISRGWIDENYGPTIAYINVDTEPNDNFFSDIVLNELKQKLNTMSVK